MITIPLDSFSDKIRRHVDPAAPPPLRMMGARGLVPAPPEELLPMLVALQKDADAEIASTAQKTLREMRPDLVLAACRAPMHAGALDGIAEVFKRDNGILEAILRNQYTSDQTYATVASTAEETITELIAQNEVRALRSPAIIEALFLNINARTSTIERLIDLARRNKLTFEGLPALQGMVEDTRYTPGANSGSDDNKFKKILEQSLIEEAEAEADDARLSELEQMKKRAKEQEDDEEGQGPRKGGNNKAAEILNMSISEKVRLATLGSRADRDMLVKDGNRMIHMAAVTSPKNQLKDIVAWSGNKQLPDNVIVYIANNPKYRRNYTIIYNLCNNPKTPLAEASRLMQQLHPKDLAALCKNRNVSGNLRRMAQALRDQRTKKRG